MLDQISDPAEIAVTSPGVEHSSMRPGSRSAVCGRLGGEIVWVRQQGLAAVLALFPLA